MHHALDYYIFAHATVLALDKYIVALASDHWLGQDIAPLPTPTIDKKKNISASNASLHQDDAHLISSLDYKIPALSTALDQNIPTLIFNYDQSNNIPIVEKEIQAHNNVINIHSLIPTKAYLVGDIPYKDLMHR